MSLAKTLYVVNVVLTIVQRLRGINYSTWVIRVIFKAIFTSVDDEKYIASGNTMDVTRNTNFVVFGSGLVKIHVVMAPARIDSQARTNRPI